MDVVRVVQRGVLLCPSRAWPPAVAASTNQPADQPGVDDQDPATAGTGTVAVLVPGPEKQGVSGTSVSSLVSGEDLVASLQHVEDRALVRVASSLSQPGSMRASLRA